VPVLGQLPGIVAAPTGLPTPPPVTRGAAPNPSFEGNADTIPLWRDPDLLGRAAIDLVRQITSERLPDR